MQDGRKATSSDAADGAQMGDQGRALILGPLRRHHRSDDTVAKSLLDRETRIKDGEEVENVERA